MKNILQGWNIMRALRLVIGTAILVQGIVSKDTMTILLGGLFGGLAVANVGCCGSNTCAITRNTNRIQKVQYEEVDR